MSIFKNTISKTGGFATAFLGALATEHLSHIGGPVLLVLSNVLTNIASEFVMPIGEEIIDQFKRKNPNELNHDIQKTLIESMKNAIEGIKILYKDKYPDIPLSIKTKRFLRRFKNEFFEEFSPEYGSILEENDLKKIIYTSEAKSENRFLFVDDGGNKISKLLYERLKEELLKYNIDESFQNLFLEKFLPLTQFYFGEKLKHDKNGAARRAMERMLSEETLKGINKLIEIQEKSNQEIENQKWLGKLGKLSKKKIEQLKALVNDLKQTNKLEIEYSEALDKRFEELIQKYENLHSGVKNIQIHIFSIRKILTTNMRIASLIVLICVASTTALLVKNNNKPFNTVITLYKDSTLSISSQYPLLQYPAKIILQFPDGKSEIQVVNLEKNEANFSKINAIWSGKKANIKLEDKYWETSNSVIELSEKTSLAIRPKKKSGEINISIFDDTRKYLDSVSIHFLDFDTTVFTSQNGSYIGLLPYNKRLGEYRIRLEKKGYDSFPITYNPFSTRVEIPLHKNQRNE